MSPLQSWIDTFTQTQTEFPQITAYAITWISAAAILIGGLILARFLRRRFRKSTFGGAKIDRTLRPIIASLIFYFIIGFSIYAFLTKIGVPASALLAVFGSAGLAIGLALKDTLSNIASGLMLLFLSPVKVGEYIETQQVSGNVVEIGLFATTLIDANGLYIYIPNRDLWNGRLLNYGRHSQRRFILDFGVSFDTNLKHAQNIALETLKGSEHVLKDTNPPQCLITDFGQTAIMMSVRCWLPAQDWLTEASSLRIELKTAFDEAGIKMPQAHNIISQI